LNFIEFEQQATKFLVHLRKEMDEAKVSLASHWNIDHICYRVETLDQYLKMKVKFADFGELLIESEVNGRPISTFKLNSPIYFEDRSIDLVELPAPKQGKKVQRGFEHIEVVVDIPFADIQSLYPKCTFNTAGLKKFFNKELELCFENNAIKFHHQSLESVINLESNSEVFNSIEGSKVLELLDPFGPLVAGTFPLKIFSSESDVDILLCSDNLRELSSKVEDHFSELEGFKTQIKEDGKAEYLLATFNYSGVHFELFGQRIPTVSQRAYRHFQLEERLLKLGGEKLRKQVISSRSQGVKTEPAFAQALNLSGDPYQVLLDIHKSSDSELSELIG